MYIILSILTFTMCLYLGTPSAFADTSVFLVKKSLKMENEAQPKHDYYINAGAKDGLKRGMVIKLFRRVPFQDTTMVKINEQLEIPIVELKLIHVQNSLAVGRVHKYLLGDNSPILDYSGVMLGDRVNLGSKRWPKKGERSVSSRSKTKNKKITKTTSPKKNEGQASFSSVAPREKAEAPQNLIKPKTPKIDQKAESLPIGGEFQPTTL